MMTRETSMEVYAKVEAAGVLSEKRRQVYQFVASHPGCTALDAENELKPRNRSTVNARFSELVKMGMIRELPGVTQVQHGNRRLTYEITGNWEPQPIVVQKSAAERAKLLATTLRDIRKFMQVDAFSGYSVDKISKTIVSAVDEVLALTRM